MSRTTERFVWLTALIGLLGFIGFSYYKAHEHDEALALIAYPPTAYDTPIIPETAEEKERRLAGLALISSTAPQDVDTMIDLLFATPDMQAIRLYDLEADRVKSYLSAEYLNAHPQSSIGQLTQDVRQGVLTYLGRAMHQGYAPAHKLYRELASDELGRALQHFRKGDPSKAWGILLPLAAEDYPPAVKKVFELTMLLAPIGDCISGSWHIQHVLNRNRQALENISYPFKGSAVLRNMPLAYAWKMKAHQLLAGNGNELDPTDFGLSPTEAQKIRNYAFATPIGQLPRGTVLPAPPVAVELSKESFLRTRRSGMHCIEDAQLTRPPGPPSATGAPILYELWLDAIKAR